MSFEKLMGSISSWITATEAMAAVGAALTLQQSGAEVPGDIAAALDGVARAAGLGDLADVPVPQQQMALGIIRMYLHTALDLLNEPGRAPGWAYTEPEILDGWGRGSMMVPPLLAAAHPDLADVNSFLDVGTGVGLLAVAAAGVWPSARIVGIDPWTPSLDRAKANVAHAGLGDRIELRQQTLAEVDDVDTYDCVWVPTFFVREEGLAESIAQAIRALRPGGWIVLGRIRPPQEPLSAAVDTLRTTRSGGSQIDATTAEKLLSGAGYTEVHTVPPGPGPSPLELTIGQRPR
jgi:SAM-dependent methyltransferase